MKRYFFFSAAIKMQAMPHREIQTGFQGFGYVCNGYPKTPYLKSAVRYIVGASMKECEILALSEVPGEVELRGLTEEIYWEPELPFG